MSGYKVTNLVGTPTDYSDRNNWFHLPENTNKPVDTFFIYPTVYINPEPDAPIIAPISDMRMRIGVKNNYPQAPLLFEDLTNLYEPYYRQTNLIAYRGMSPAEVTALQLREQRTDLYAALDYFFDHYNEGRPFILAGHSQGSIMLKIALQDYFLEHTEYLERMAVVDIKVNRPGLADAQLDLERGTVICTTLADHYVKPLTPGAKNIFGPASLHLSDYPAYWENIRENVKTRIRAYFDGR